MSPQPIPWLLSTISLLFLFQALIGSTRADEFYNSCGNTFTCGTTISNINYPFRSLNDPSYCGYPGFVLTCNDHTNITNINMLSMNFRVLDIDQATQTMRIAREDVMGDGITCPTKMMNTTLDYSVFDYAGAYINYTFLYGCPDLNYLNLHNVSCGDKRDAYILSGEYGPGDCNASVVIPGPVNSGSNGGGALNALELGGILRQGFLIRWKIGDHACSICTTTKGRCGYVNQTVCFCADSPYALDACPMDYVTSPPVPSKFPASGPISNDGTITNDRSTSRRNIALLIVGALLGGVGLGWLIFFGLQKRKIRRFASANSRTQTIPKDVTPSPWVSNDLALSILSNNLNKTTSSCQSSHSILGNDTSYFGVQVFNYAELERATNNFDSSRELGDGGFGTVYYGVLPDGRMVAVKRLYEHCFKRVEQFMNEVEILTRLRHKNLVSLYGCTSRRSRELLLVYEYIPNGTVADHLHGRRAKSGLLSWPVRLNIAIETANALAYLHGSDIIHRDVKTNNILLDVDFHVKVADFGLSRLFPNNVTHVSTAPQGTPGYVDPEYYQCYQLTEKSDVYSFGVVLVELISSLLAVDTSRHREEINLSSMAINKILSHNLHELVDSSLGFETNGLVRRTITLVAELAFQCLQQEKDMRPSMEEVVEVLKGIQNDKLNADEPEIVDMVMDEDAGLLRTPLSPDSVFTDSVV